MILPRAHRRLAPVLLIMTTPPLSPRGHPRGDSKCMTRAVEPRPARGTPRAGRGSTTPRRVLTSDKSTENDHSAAMTPATRPLSSVYVTVAAVDLQGGEGTGKATVHSTYVQLRIIAGQYYYFLHH